MFKCVYSEELLKNKGVDNSAEIDANLSSKEKGGPGDPDLVNHDWNATKAQINGSLAHITAIFGFTIAGLVLQDIQAKAEASL